MNLTHLKFLQRRKIWFITGILFILGIIFIYILNFLTLREIKIVGNDYLQENFILKMLPQPPVSLWNLDKQAILERLKSNPFIEDVALETRFFRTLIVDIKPVSLVGKTYKNNKMEYINENGQYLTGSFVDSKYFITEIVMSKDINNANIQFLSQQLAIIKYNYSEFFKRIKKIDLLEPKNVSIFIANDTLGILREYKLYRVPTVQDFVKIQILDGKYNQGSVLILDGDALIVQS